MTDTCFDLMRTPNDLSNTTLISRSGVVGEAGIWSLIRTLCRHNASDKNYNFPNGIHLPALKGPLSPMDILEIMEHFFLTVIELRVAIAGGF